MFLLKGIKFNPHSFFECDGVQYPANWFETATQEEKAAVGITEVPDEPMPDDRFYHVQENSDGTRTTNLKNMDMVKTQFKNSIDLTSGSLRAKVVSMGDFVAEEYRVAYDEALNFKAAGYAGTVPQSILTWSQVSGNTAQWAADDIISTRNQYVTILNIIRDVRLKSKAAIEAATTPEGILAAVDAANASFISISSSLG